MKTKFYLTENGNVLNTEKKCFQTLNGKFLRLASESELGYLTVVLTPVQFLEEIQEPEETPVWEFICQTQTTYFSHFAGSACYTEPYQIYLNVLYFGRNNNGSPEFRKMEKWSNSLTWEYSNRGRFVPQTIAVNIFDCDIELTFLEEGYEVDEEVYAPLDAYSTSCTAREVLYAQGDEILTFDERVRRYKLLKQLGPMLFLPLQRKRRRKITAKYN